MQRSLGGNGGDRSKDWWNYKFQTASIVQKLGLTPEQDGDELTVFCPFHKEGRRANLGINAVTGLWQCWSCGEKGNLPGLVSKLRQISYREAIQYLVSFSNVPSIQELKEANLRELDKILTHHRKALPKININAYKHGGTWWSVICGFDRQTIRRFCLGYDSRSNRAVIPIRFYGYWVSTIKRATNGTQYPRYLYERDFDRGSVLYPWDSVPERSRRCDLVEGPRDVLRLHSYNISTALAVLGSGITAEQTKLIINNFDEVNIWFDDDVSGHLHNLLAAETLAEFIPKLFVVPYATKRSVKDQFEMNKSEVEESLKNRIHWSFLL